MVEVSPRCGRHHVQSSLEGDRVVHNNSDFDRFHVNPVSSPYVGCTFGAKGDFPHAAFGNGECLAILEGSVYLIGTGSNDKPVAEFFGDATRNIIDASIWWIDVDSDRERSGVTSAGLIRHYRHATLWRHTIEMGQKVVEDHLTLFELFVAYVCGAEVVVSVYGPC